MNSSGKHLLVIAYEFPPTAGPGVQRITALTKYLQRLGWRVSVICGEPVPSAPTDSSMLADVAGAHVVALPGRHVATAIARMLGPLKRSRAASATSAGGVVPAAGPTSATAIAPASAPDAPARRPLSGRISRWLAVPDDAVLWRRSATRAALRLHAHDPVDVVLATGPPYSAMLAGCDVADSVGVPVVLDLRDPWRDNAALYWPTAWHRARSAALERRAMACASALIAVSEPIAEEARSLGAANVSVLPNGFDPERVPAWKPDASAPLTLAFMGRFSRALTDPEPLFAGMALAARQSAAAASVRLVIAGPEYPWVDALITRYGLSERVEVRGYLPNVQALAVVAQADVGVIVLADVPGAKAIYSSKLFDYLGISIPVLLVGPSDCAAADVLREADAGTVVAPDAQAVASAIVALAEAKVAGSRAPLPHAAVIARFSRVSQAGELSALLEHVAGERP